MPCETVEDGMRPRAERKRSKKKVWNNIKAGSGGNVSLFSRDEKRWGAWSGLNIIRGGEGLIGRAKRFGSQR